VNLVADLEDPAVHEPSRHWRELAANDREHRLVEQLESGADLSLVDERTPFDVTGHRCKIGVAESLADGRGSRGARPRLGRFSLLQLPIDTREQKVALLDTIDAFDESLTAGYPRIGPCDLTAKLKR
jgi:hypothetical protein